MGERSFDYEALDRRAGRRGRTCVYRAAWRIEPGIPITVDDRRTGSVYFIPLKMLNADPHPDRNGGRWAASIDYDALEAYRDFGGIRIEDDILVTDRSVVCGSRIIGDRKIPVTVDFHSGTGRLKKPF